MICSFNRLVILWAALHAAFLIAREFTFKISHLTTFKDKQNRERERETERERERKEFSGFFLIWIWCDSKSLPGQRNLPPSSEASRIDRSSAWLRLTKGKYYFLFLTVHRRSSRRQSSKRRHLSPVLSYSHRACDTVDLALIRSNSDVTHLEVVRRTSVLLIFLF